MWTYALSPYAQASQTGQSLTQLSDGAIVVGGNDAYQPNYCFKPSHPFRGGAWLVAVTSGGGGNVWQNLYSTCASAAQSASAVSGTPDGGLVLVGGDFDNPACGAGCGWFAKLNAQGSILWQHDLTGADAAGATSLATLPDGSFLTAGNETTTPAFTLQALITKITATGALQWSRTYDETDQSFPGAYSGANFTFESIQRTSDRGYIASGVADAKFSSGYANVLVVMKLDAAGAVQWSNVYYGTNWLSGAAGSSPYPIFQTAGGGFAHVPPAPLVSSNSQAARTATGARSAGRVCPGASRGDTNGPPGRHQPRPSASRPGHLAPRWKNASRARKTPRLGHQP